MFGVANRVLFFFGMRMCEQGDCANGRRVSWRSFYTNFVCLPWCIYGKVTNSQSITESEESHGDITGYLSLKQKEHMELQRAQPNIMTLLAMVTPVSLLWRAAACNPIRWSKNGSTHIYIWQIFIFHLDILHRHAKSSTGRPSLLTLTYINYKTVWIQWNEPSEVLVIFFLWIAIYLPI